MFKKEKNVAAIEEGKLLSLNLTKMVSFQSLPLTVIQVNLMHGYMNSEALKKTIENKAFYWSRSRRSLAQR